MASRISSLAACASAVIICASLASLANLMCLEYLLAKRFRSQRNRHNVKALIIYAALSALRWSRIFFGRPPRRPLALRAAFALAKFHRAALTLKSDRLSPPLRPNSTSGLEACSFNLAAALRFQVKGAS